MKAINTSWGRVRKKYEVNIRIPLPSRGMMCLIFPLPPPSIRASATSPYLQLIHVIRIRNQKAEVADRISFIRFTYNNVAELRIEIPPIGLHRPLLPFPLLPRRHLPRPSPFCGRQKRLNCASDEARAPATCRTPRRGGLAKVKFGKKPQARRSPRWKGIPQPQRPAPHGGPIFGFLRRHEGLYFLAPRETPGAALTTAFSLP